MRVGWFRLAALVLACAGLLAFPAVAADGSGVDKEVESLLGRLAISGCAFERNGTWHTAEEARTHLLRKRDYLARRGAIESSEQFIALAGSGSSTSGKPYRVRCGESAPVESRIWLLDQLQLLRRAAGGSR